jgi:hypothetical protein
MRPVKKNTRIEEDDFIARPGLARRWKCHSETIRRREREGQLHPIQLGERMIRYSMREVLAIEHEAAAVRVAKAQEEGARPGTIKAR